MLLDFLNLIGDMKIADRTCHRLSKQSAEMLRPEKLPWHPYARDDRARFTSMLPSSAFDSDNLVLSAGESNFDDFRGGMSGHFTSTESADNLSALPSLRFHAATNSGTSSGNDGIFAPQHSSVIHRADGLFRRHLTARGLPQNGQASSSGAGPKISLFI